MAPAIVVLGDSVPNGERTDATAWPHRLPALSDDSADATVTVHGSMGTELAGLADDIPDALTDGEQVVLVHAGHNDAQLGGGDPRVPLAAFADAAADLDDALADHAAVTAHAFVGLVPLLPIDDPGAVPFADAQPERSLRYDDALADAVRTHLPVARPVSAWRERTADGVHPNDAGHAAIADAVAAWLDDGSGP